MFAVIKTGGKQYRVQAGDVLEVEKLNVEKGKKVNFDHVLLIDDEKKTLIGTPFLKNAQVKAEVIENFKDKKVIVFKKKRRKQYRKKMGHRQQLTRVRIDEIITELKLTLKKVEEKPAKVESKKAAKPGVTKETKSAKESVKVEPKKTVKPKTAATTPAKPKAGTKSAAKAKKTN